MSRLGGEMYKYIKFLSIFVLLALSFSTLPSGQFGLVTFFGPEIFVRGRGQPVEEVREFSTEGFLGPFYLHLRNGDELEENRMSSADVWLNDELVFGPEDFSQQVWDYDIEVDLQTDNILKVKATSVPGSYLTIWIEGTPLDPYHFQDVSIYPEGGRYVLYNGIILDVPPGAVNEMLTFSIRRLSPEEIQPVLDSYGLEKYFLSGFEVGSDYFVFNEPITISIPSEPLMSAADLPFHYEVNPLQQMHTLAGPDSYLNSLVTVAAGEDCQGILYTETDPETGTKVSLCIPKFDPNNQEVIAAVKEVLKDNAGVDCNVLDPPCFCTNLEVIEDSRDYIVDKECEYYEVTGRAIYHDCAGIVNTWSFVEDKRPAIMTDPPVGEDEVYILVEGDFQSFQFWLEDKLGNEVPSQILDADINDPNGVLEIIQKEPKSISLLGNSCGKAELIINAGCENKKTINISVGIVNEVKIDPPAKTTLEVCDTLQLYATVYDHNGDPIEGFPVDWSYISPDTAAVNLDPATGFLEANGAGEIDVRASICHESDEITLTINPKVKLQPEGLSELKVGDSMPLLVRVEEEECGVAVENPDLIWTIPEDIISVDISDPANYTVTGVAEGTATLTVTYMGFSDSIFIKVISDQQGGEVAHIEVYPFTVRVEGGDTFKIGATLYDQNWNEIDDPQILGDLEWRSADEVIAQVDQDGNGVGLSQGFTTIWVSYKDISQYCGVYVLSSLVDSITVTPDYVEAIYTYNEVNSFLLRAAPLDKNGEIIDEYPVIWRWGDGRYWDQGLETRVSSQFDIEGIRTLTATCLDKSATATIEYNDSRDIRGVWIITYTLTSVSQVNLDFTPEDLRNAPTHDMAFFGDEPYSGTGWAGFYPPMGYPAPGCSVPDDYAAWSVDPTNNFSFYSSETIAEKDFRSCNPELIGVVVNSAHISGTWKMTTGYWRHTNFPPPNDIIWYTCVYRGTFEAYRR